MDQHLELFTVLAKSHELIGDYRDGLITYDQLETEMAMIGFQINEIKEDSVDIQMIQHDA